MLSRLRIDNAPRASGGSAGLRAIRRFWNPRTALIWSVLIVFVVGSSIINPVFREPRNLLNILSQSTILALVAIGQTIVILTAGIDLSVSSVVKLSAMLGAAVMAGQDGMLIPAVLVMLAVALAVGLFNGFLIARIQMPAFIVTFSTYFLLRGLAFMFSTSPVGRSAPLVFDFYSASFVGLPAVLLPMAAVWIGTWFVLKRTTYGRHVYGVGGDPKAAALAGVNVKRIQMSVYVVSALLAGVAALYIIGRNGVGDPRMGEGLELDSITAVILGGASFFGGRGSIVGTLGGVLVIIVIGNMFNILQIDVFYQQALKGLILIGAVAALRVRT